MIRMTTVKRKLKLFPKEDGYYPYVWLVYMVIPIILINLQMGTKLFGGYALILLFFIAYRQLHWTTGARYHLWLSVQFAIMAILSLWINPYYVFMGFFPASFIGLYKQEKQFKVALAALIIIIFLAIFKAGLDADFDPLNLTYIIPFMVVMIMMPFANRSHQKRKELQKQLNAANAQIELLIKREERVRIARDLHDTLGHTLSLITLKSQLVEKLVIRDPVRAAAEANEIQLTSRAALQQVRELVSDMRTTTISEELAETEHILQAAHIQLHINGAAPSMLPPLMQNIISMCIKESVTNMIKHSAATDCTISFTFTPSLITVSIEDNGIGLPNNSSNQQYGNGLNGMKERLGLIEGTLLLENGDSAGCKLTIQVPLTVKTQQQEESV